MDKKNIKLPCEQCGKEHEIELDFDMLSTSQKNGEEPIFNTGFYCPSTAWMYKVTGFVIDTRSQIVNNFETRRSEDKIVSGLIDDWGKLNFEKKLDRFKHLSISLLGIPEEYYNLLWDVVSVYCCGRFYPAMTSAGALGERILNRLILRTKKYYKSSKHFKYIYNKNSFDNWKKMINILLEWDIISSEIGRTFTRLLQFRKDSIHYSDGYDFEINSHDAVLAIVEIINGQFNYLRRQDLFWVFDVPGEILVRSDKVEDAFVKEFVLPYCTLITPYCEPTANPPVKGKNVPQRPLSDEDFISMRKQRRNKTTLSNDY